jgi:hypothetical protein
VKEWKIKEVAGAGETHDSLKGKHNYKVDQLL